MPCWQKRWPRSWLSRSPLRWDSNRCEHHHRLFVQCNCRHQPDSSQRQQQQQLVVLQTFEWGAATQSYQHCEGQLQCQQGPSDSIDDLAAAPITLRSTLHHVSAISVAGLPNKKQVEGNNLIVLASKTKYLPACLPACVSACLPTCLPACLRAAVLSSLPSSCPAALRTPHLVVVVAAAAVSLRHDDEVVCCFVCLCCTNYKSSQVKR